MEPSGRDLWVPYRVNTLDLGRRVLEVMKELSRQQRGDKDLLLPLRQIDSDVVWLRKAA